MDSISIAGKLVKLANLFQLDRTSFAKFNSQVQMSWFLNGTCPLVANQIPASHQLSEEVLEECDFGDL